MHFCIKIDKAMNPRLFSRETTKTLFIQLDTRKCIACWECIENCQKQVIGKVDLPWHKHALIINPDDCSGCRKCTKVCESEAISAINKAKEERQMQKKSVFSNFIINNLLLISGLVMVISGLVMQLGFHVGSPDIHQNNVQEITSQIPYEQMREIDTTKVVCALHYPDWSITHKYVIVLFSLLMIYHIYIHWKWYKGIVKKHLIGKHIQVSILSVLFVLVALTGLIPWFIDLSGGKSILRFGLIEIHDKLALVLVVYLFLHLIKRKKWFSNTYAKLKG